MYDNNLVLATTLDPFYKIAFFESQHQSRCKDLLIQTVENSIRFDEILPESVADFEDDDDPIERFLRQNSLEKENVGGGPSQLQRSQEICSPPILDEKLRAIHV
jgi:hypothetical protein